MVTKPTHSQKARMSGTPGGSLNRRVRPRCSLSNCRVYLSHSFVVTSELVAELRLGQGGLGTRPLGGRGWWRENSDPTQELLHLIPIQAFGSLELPPLTN